VAQMIWLYRCSPVFQRASADDDEECGAAARASGVKAVSLLIAGVGAMVLGAELLVSAVRMLLSTVRVSETFLGMAVIGMGESLEETARMVVPARRGHPELAWGNVVGTVVVLLTLNLGIIALTRPLTADPLVLRLHIPYLIGCTLVVALALLCSRRLGRGMGAALIGLYGLYLALNLPHVWQ
jgi:cation:H+ antiporter